MIRLNGSSGTQLLLGLRVLVETAVGKTQEVVRFEGFRMIEYIRLQDWYSLCIVTQKGEALGQRKASLRIGRVQPCGLPVFVPCLAKRLLVGVDRS